MALRKKLIYNTALLTGSSLLMNCIGMAFQIWLVGRIGTAGIGLYQLVCSVTALSATVAISGIRFACTRLVSEELGLENSAGIRGAMRRCTAYGLFFGAASTYKIHNIAELREFWGKKPHHIPFIEEELVPGHVESFDGVTDSRKQVLFCASQVLPGSLMDAVNLDEDVVSYCQAPDQGLREAGERLLQEFPKGWQRHF